MKEKSCGDELYQLSSFCSGKSISPLFLWTTLAGKVFWLAVFVFFFSFSTLDTSSHSLPWMKGLTTGVSMAVEICDASQAGGVQVHSWRSKQKLRFRPVTRDRLNAESPEASEGALAVSTDVLDCRSCWMHTQH